jgi:hypothetical protein
MEDKYWNLREEVDRTWDAYCRTPSFSAEIRHTEALREFQEFCVEVLEQLMENNSDILRNLKEC